MISESAIAKFLVEETENLTREEMLFQFGRRFPEATEDEFWRGVYTAVVIERANSAERGDPYSVSDAIAKLAKVSKREVLDRFEGLLLEQAKMRATD